MFYLVFDQHISFRCSWVRALFVRDRCSSSRIGQALLVAPGRLLNMTSNTRSQTSLFCEKIPRPCTWRRVLVERPKTHTRVYTHPRLIYHRTLRRPFPCTGYRPRDTTKSVQETSRWVPVKVSPSLGPLRLLSDKVASFCYRWVKRSAIDDVVPSD